MKLRAMPFAFTSGLFTGTPLLLVTLWLLYTGTPGTTIGQLDQLLPGFAFSPMGAMVGFGWLFLGGMAVVALILRNVIGTLRGSKNTFMSAGRGRESK